MNEERNTTRERVLIYETTEPLLTAMFAQVRELARKKPDGTLNVNKVKMINRLLQDIQEVLADEPESKYLDSLSDEDLPQNSDVVLLLSQYVTSLKSFRTRYFRMDELEGERLWHTS